MCQSYLYHELSSTQIVSFHYTPSLLHIPKMMMNVAMTLQPTAKYSTHLHILLFSTPLLLLFFSIISLPPFIFVYVHSSMLPFSFDILCNFLIALSTLMLLWTPKLQKHAQLPTTNVNRFQWLPLFSILELPAHYIHFLTFLSSFN